MKSWMVRPKPHGICRIREFLFNNFVAVGWPEIGNLSGKSRNDLKNSLITYPYNYDGGKLKNSLTTLDYFVNQMAIDDMVLVPHDEFVHIGQISDNYWFEKANKDDGYPHQRKIEWKAKISKNDLPAEILSSLHTLITIADFTKHDKKIREIAESFTNTKGETKIRQLVDDALEILKYEMQSNDPDIRLKAAQIVVNSGLVDSKELTLP